MLLRKLRSEAVSSLALLVLLLYGSLPRALPSKVLTHDCGTRPLIDEKQTGTQVVGDPAAQLGAWPWLVSLQIYRVFQGGYRHKCGGSLISNNSVLTAAHCIKEWVNPEYWRVVIGLQHLYKQHTHTINRRVRAIVVHSHFKMNSFDNDIALFKLIKFVEYNEYIQPICLPDIPLLVTNKNPCYTSGWESKEKEGSLKYILQESQVDIIPLYICVRHPWYAGHGLSRNILCADSASGHKDTCQGESGGALMCYFPNVSKYYLIGITTSSISCGQPKYPGTYLRTSHYTNWVVSQLRGRTSTVSIRCVLIFFTVNWVTFDLVL